MAKRRSVETMPAEGGARVSDHLELLAEMGRDFAASLDIEATLEGAVARITDYLDAAGGALFLLEDEGATLRCCASTGSTDITGLTMSSGEGIVGRCVQTNTGEIVRDVQRDPGFYQAVDEQTGFTTRSILCAPMSVQDQRIGAIELVNKRSGDGLFAESDLRFLEALSTSAGLAILNARQAKALMVQEGVRRELELAAEIQRSLLPAVRPAPFPVHGVNVPARTVSGDFYDYFEVDDGRICFNLGDVSGKGMSAALLMAKTASLYRCLGKTVHAPGSLLARINAEICETATRGMFVTMVAGILDPQAGVVRLANAGHEPPLFHHLSGSFMALPADAPPLGIVPPASPDDAYPETELRLDGGTLYVFTDGVTEGYLEDGTVLEVEGLQALIRDSAGLGVAERLDAVVARLGGDRRALRDDLTMLAVQDTRAEIGKGSPTPERPVTGENAGEVLLVLDFPARADRLKGVRDAVLEAVGGYGCGEAVARDVVLAVDEACQNVIRHAYADKPDGEITLDILGRGDSIVVLLRDFAAGVDADKIRPRDVEDLRPGGLGTRFIGEIMDEIEFLPPPKGRGNLLRMVKRIA